MSVGFTLLCHRRPVSHPPLVRVASKEFVQFLKRAGTLRVLSCSNNAILAASEFSLPHMIRVARIRLADRLASQFAFSTVEPVVVIGIGAVSPAPIKFLRIPFGVGCDRGALRT